MDQNDRLPSHTYSHYFSLTSSLHLPAPFARGSQETERVAGFIAIIMEEFVHSRGTEQREQDGGLVGVYDLLFLGARSSNADGTKLGAITLFICSDFYCSCKWATLSLGRKVGHFRRGM